jgi:VWFA-related protein
MKRLRQGGLVLVPILVAGMALAVEPDSRAEATDGSTVVMEVAVEYKGAAVAGLAARNFHVFEDGEAREVISAEPAGPASIVLLVENSLHSWRFLNDVRSAMRGFLKTAPEEKGHSYALVTYERQPVVEQSLTREIGRIREAFAGVEQSAWGKTDTYDSIFRVLEAMGSLPGRRVLIFIGVGYDAFSRHTFGELGNKVEVENVQVYGFATGSGLRQNAEQNWTPDLPDLQQGEMLIRMLVRRSGGKWFCPSCEADYADSMRDTMRTLDRQYTVRYRRRGPLEPGFHKVTVEAFDLVDDVRRDYRVRAREGWRIERAGR